MDVVIATAAGLPDGTLLDRVRDYYKERREIAVDVAVLAPESKTVNVAVSVTPKTGSSFAEVKTAVEQAVTAWFGGARLGKSVLRAALGQVVFDAAGVANYTVTAPAGDVAITAAQLPRLGTLTVTPQGGMT